MNSMNNISIFFNEKNDLDNNNNNNDYDNDIKKMMDEFTELDLENNNQKLNKMINHPIILNDYTVKELFKICNYYEIDKYVKEFKLKKQDIINTIVYFESLPENNNTVRKRYLMWENIYELLNDPKMKKFIIW